MRFFKCRRDANVLARQLIHNMQNRQEDWSLDVDSKEIVFNKTIAGIVLTPRRLRIFDRVQVKLAGIDVWIPLRLRLKIRREARALLARACLFEVK